MNTNKVVVNSKNHNSLASDDIHSKGLLDDVKKNKNYSYKNSLQRKLSKDTRSKQLNDSLYGPAKESDSSKSYLDHGDARHEGSISSLSKK